MKVISIDQAHDLWYKHLIFKFDFGTFCDILKEQNWSIV